MNSETSEGADDEDHSRAGELLLAATKLDVYRHERLAFTEIRPMKADSHPVSKRASAVLKTIRHWIPSLW
jgi:hypothetical protein